MPVEGSLIPSYSRLRTVSGWMYQCQGTLESLCRLIHRRVRTRVGWSFTNWFWRCFERGWFGHLSGRGRRCCEGFRCSHGSRTLIRLSALDHRVVVIVPLEELLNGFASQHFLIFLLYFRIFLILPSILARPWVEIILLRLLLSPSYIWHIGCSYSFVIQIIPGEISKPWMCLHFIGSIQS